MESTNRKRLAQAVIARRVELGMTTTKALAEEAKLSPRMLGDVENGRRDNYSDGAKAQIERALAWDSGSIDAVLAGKTPFVSGVIKGRSGRSLSRWTAMDGADQVELELYRLAYIILDTRDLVHSQAGPLKTAVTTLIDEATELVTRQVARWRLGDEDIDDEALADAQWFLDETRDSNNIRRRGQVYLADRDPNPVARLSPVPVQDAPRRHDQRSDDVPSDLADAARKAPPGYTPGVAEHGDADGEESQLDPNETD